MLYGRDAERSRIGEALDAARRSRSAVLVIRGEAGVGKSALLEDARARAGDMRVLESRGVESEAHLPFASVHQLVRPILGHLEDLPPPQAKALRCALGLQEGAGDERFLVSLGVLSLLAEAAERRPVLCLIDDAQWIDDASADALGFVARRLEAEDIVMLLAARDGEARRFDSRALPELYLDGLGPEAARALLDSLPDLALSSEVRDRLIEGSGGNPLALLELPLALTEGQRTGAEALLEPLPVGARVEHAFLARLRRLPAETQTFLLVAAAEDTGQLPTVLGAARGLGAAAPALDAAERAGLVRLRGTRIEFRHPLLRSAIYQRAPLSRRQAAHRALADVLDVDAEADRHAWHSAAASVEPDPVIVERLEQAAERALRRSGFTAASLAFERAATLSHDGPERVRRLVRAAVNAWFGGRPQRARILYDRARALATEPLLRADIDLGRGIIELYVGVPADACALLSRAARDIAPVDRERALYMLGGASLAAAYGDNEAAVAVAAAAGPARAEDGPVARFLTAFVVGTGEQFAGAFDRAAPRLREALGTAGEADANGSARFPALLALAGAAALFLGDDRAVHRFNRTLAARARDAGAIGILTQALPRLALAEMWLGRWAPAQAVLREGIELAQGSEQHQVVAHQLAVLALLAAWRGEEDECRSLAAESLERGAARRLVHVENTARWALTALELSRGRADDALAHARQMTDSPVALHAAIDRIEAAARASDREAAAAWIAGVASWAESGGVGWAHAVALHGRALLAESVDSADRLFQAALEAHADAGRPFERARTQLARGELLRRAGRRIDAREHLRAALDSFESLGARLWVERARLELRASGQTARRREPSARVALTSQELQIAQLVAQGLSNREVAAQLFLSPRTIEFHLRSVFRKVGISSRGELLRLELGVATPSGGEPASPAISPVRG